MVHAYYLSSKTTEQPKSIVIRQNWHNPKGWIEKPNGDAVKLYKPLSNEVEHATSKASN